MLQQTQVNRVMSEFYPKFLEKFPTLEKLALAPLDEVLATWSGLGYYSRARNIHKTANLSPKKLPETMKELLSLPGIGKYTASAICSFGYNQSVSVVDTNISRVLKRYCGFIDVKVDIVHKSADELLNHENPRSHNLALMDLGSMVCTPTNPACENCPLENSCLGKNNPELYTTKKKVNYENMDLFYGVMIKNNQIALQKTNGSMYKEMLELPSIDPIDENFITSFKHSYTKYRLDVQLYKIEEPKIDALDITEDDIVWIDMNSLDTLPISTLTKKALKRINTLL
jgi:A/G-specific adenine glycosylase